MIERRHTFPEIALLLAIAAIACMLFNIPDQARQGIPMTMYMILFAFALISYLCARLLFRKPKSMGVAVLYHVVLIGSGFFAAILLHQVTGTASGIFLGVVFLVLTVMAFIETTKGISINNLTLCFDVLVVLLLIYILLTELGKGELAAVLPGAVGVVAAFTGIMVLRGDGRSQGREHLLRLVIILAILVIAFLASLLAGDSLREGFAGAFTGIGAALSWIGQILKRFLLFIGSLFPEEQLEVADAETGGGISMPEGQVEETAAWSAGPLLVLGGILIIAVIVVMIIVFRKHRFSGKRVTSTAGRTTAVKRNRISLWNAIKIWRKEKLYQLQVRLFFLRNRKTPAGRFYKLVRSLKHSSHALRQGETPREFLSRYIATLKPGDKRIPDLTSLIEELNMQLYR